MQAAHLQYISFYQTEYSPRPEEQDRTETEQGGSNQVHVDRKDTLNREKYISVGHVSSLVDSMYVRQGLLVLPLLRICISGSGPVLKQ